jgi:3-hydroxybutyryl-CoA dehydrogenase
LEQGERDAALGLIDAVDDVAGLAPVDLVIEAASEDPDAKRAIFGRLGEVTRPEVVLASNTSSIPIATLGEASAHAERVIGMHFFNPVPVMGLIELTPSAATSDDTLALAQAFGTEVLGKTCVRSSDEAGFIVNRLLIPYLFDAMRLYERGFATREDIDAAIQLGLAHPMGPLRLSDLIGLDTVLSIGEVLHRAFGEERYDAPTVLRSLVAKGKLGRKTGEGFYSY